MAGIAAGSLNGESTPQHQCQRQHAMGPGRLPGPRLSTTWSLPADEAVSPARPRQLLTLTRDVADSKVSRTAELPGSLKYPWALMSYSGPDTNEPM